MAVPYLLSGMFSFCTKLVPAMKKESIFTKEGFFGCDVFQSSVLEVAKKYIIAESIFCGSGDTVAFSRRSLIFQRQEKAGGSFFVDIQKRS
jgi:hypothetical protein